MCVKWERRSIIAVNEEGITSERGHEGLVLRISFTNPQIIFSCKSADLGRIFLNGPLGKTPGRLAFYVGDVILFSMEGWRIYFPFSCMPRSNVQPPK